MTRSSAHPVFHLDARPERRAGLQCHTLDDEAVLYDLAQHSVHYLNSTALLIWQHCDGQTNTRNLLKEVTTHFDDNALPPPAELRAALANLIDNGLVDWGRP